MKRRRGTYSKLISAILVILPSTVAGVAHAADDVSFALNWIISGRNAGYFVALEKGFYSDNGLNVTISRGNGSGDTLKRVAIGESTFGLVDAATVIASVANDNAPVKMIAMMYGKAAFAVLYPTSSGIETPKDLENKTIARAASGASANMWPVFLKLNGVDGSKVEEVIATSSTNVPMLMSGQVDAVLDQSSYLGRYQKAVEPRGLEMRAMRYADYGLPLYGDSIIATDTTIAENPDMVTRFLDATLKGVLYAFEHPDEAIEILAEHAEEIEAAEIAKAELLDMKELALTDEVKEHGYGYMSEERLTEMVNLIAEPLDMKRKVEPSEVMTLEFLKEQTPPGEGAQ